MCYLFRYTVPMLLMAVLTGNAAGIELPPVEQLERESGLTRQAVNVVEPHESTTARPVIVGYLGLPMDTLLTRWFGKAWQAPGAKLVFQAKDGYRSVIAGAKLQRFRAYLAFARVDGTPFVVNNADQHERRIPLDPYYLIWDNRGNDELLGDGAYGWPYQVTTIELRSAANDRALLPKQPTDDSRQALAEATKYCLSCHRIRGQGGQKYPEDLARAACRWTDADLNSWIDDPGRMRPGTAMPRLAPTLLDDERRSVIERIVAYLRAIEIDDAACASPGG
jgi:mono/diheme cytochrome c family protein